MTQGAASPRKLSQPAPEGAAEISAIASRETVVARAIPLDLMPLISSYRAQRGITLRIEDLPPLGRLSAGQDNGDNSWSLALDELEGLSYFPPEGFHKQHTLKLRLIAKTKRGASPVALIDFLIMGDDERANAPPFEVAAGRTEPNPPAGGLLKKILSLRAALGRHDAAMPLGVDQESAETKDAPDGREAERPQFASITAGLLIRKTEAQTSAERPQSASLTADLLARKGEAQPWSGLGTQEAEIAAAKVATAHAAAVKLKAAEAQWQDKSAKSVAEITARCRAAEAALASARAAAEHRKAEIAELHDQLERLRRHREMEIAAAKLEAAETLKAAEAQWQDNSVRSVAELTARCRVAEEALASARAAERSHAAAELTDLHDQLERLRRHREVEIDAAKLEAAETLKAAEAQWQEKAARSVAELTARCRVAEEALASARTAAQGTRPEAEVAALQDQLERLRRNGEAQIAAAKLEAAETRKAAEARWQEKAARSLAELTARCRVAEDALASARTAAQGTRPEAEVAVLQDQLERLRRNGEAQIAAAKLAAAETLKAAEAQWQDQAAQSVAELTARCRAAEEALASARAAAGPPEAALAALQDQLQSLRRNGEAEVAAAKLEAAETLKAAEAQWRDQAAQSVAEVTARCRAAEEALASAYAADTGKGETDHAYVRRLNHDINSLQRSLAEREAHLEQALARLEELRLAPAAPSPVNTWNPLSNRDAEVEAEDAQDPSHLWRDALIVFFAVMGAVLFWPRVEEALMTAGVLDVPAQPRAVIAAPPAPAPAPLPPPKPDHPATTVTRGVNMRAAPATGAEVLASLKSGMPVVVIGQTGNWDEVEISGAGGKTLQGWVYKSYLDTSGTVSPH